MIATSNFSDKNGDLALGVNLTTAIMPYRSSNFEDAFVVTEAGAKKLEAEQIMTHRIEKRMGIETKLDKYVSLFPNKFYNTQVQNLDADGVVKKGTILHYGDPVILAYAPKTIKTTDIHLGKLSKALSHAYRDVTDKWDYENPGVVTDVSKQGALILETSFLFTLEIKELQDLFCQILKHQHKRMENLLILFLIQCLLLRVYLLH